MESSASQTSSALSLGRAPGLPQHTLAHALSNGPWKGLYLADEDAPHQYQSNSCGVLMLMGDMLSIRRWWLDSCWRPLYLKALQD
ncbi:unnamed protein product [Gadus morhua 'NCC']